MLNRLKGKFKTLSRLIPTKTQVCVQNHECFRYSNSVRSQSVCLLGVTSKPNELKSSDFLIQFHGTPGEEYRA